MEETHKPEASANADNNVPEIKLQFHTTEIFGKVSRSTDAAELIRKIISEDTMELQEQAIVLYLNRANNVIGYYRHTTGGVNSTIMDVKLIISTALKSLSSGIIIAHNHPSGNLKPSDQDIAITNSIKKAAQTVDITFMDHIIITKEGYYSFADEGLAGLYQQNNEEDSTLKIVEDKPNVSEKAGREAAKRLIYGYVERGDSVDQLKRGQTGRYSPDFAATIKGNKIIVERLGTKKVDFSFPLQSIYNEIMDELYASGKVVEQESKPLTKKAPIKKEAPKKKTPRSEPEKNKTNAKPVERIGEEVKLIKRYAIMEGKEKTIDQLLNFLAAVQKPIVEKRIRKTSPFKKEIDYIQTNLVKLTNALRKIKNPIKRIAEIKINPEVLKKFQQIGGSERVRLSVNYVKRYIGIQGKNLTKEKAQRLFDTLTKAVKAKKIFADDPFAKQLQAVYKSLLDFLKVAKKNDTLEIHTEVLNGLNAALDGCNCEEKEEEEEPLCSKENMFSGTPKQRIMNSVDFANLKFDTLGFTGKWKQLIGDPSPGFRAMVSGKPKYGKSYLCVDWAGYLARHHGNTLYVAKEEKLDATLQMKLNDKNVKHRCLDVSDYLPDDLSPYQFIFLDSVNKLGLTPQQVDGLAEENPGKTIIEICQVTKNGVFRGSNERQHDVDVVIEVPEKGRAIQFGRFNQGGEIAIFEDQEFKEAA